MTTGEVTERFDTELQEERVHSGILNEVIDLCKASYKRKRSFPLRWLISMTQFCLCSASVYLSIVTVL